MFLCSICVHVFMCSPCGKLYFPLSVLGLRRFWSHKINLAAHKINLRAHISNLWSHKINLRAHKINLAFLSYPQSVCCSHKELFYV